MQNLKDPNLCDRSDVWIIEIYNGTLRGVSRAIHTNVTDFTQFNLAGSLFGTYHSRPVGITINDTAAIAHIDTSLTAQNSRASRDD
jgi:hypothetical protein